jgi:hypothetical protein
LFSLHSLTVLTPIPSAILEWFQSVVAFAFGRNICTVCRLRHKYSKIIRISDLSVISALWENGFVQIQTSLQSKLKPQGNALQLYCNKISDLIRKLKEYQWR